VRGGREAAAEGDNSNFNILWVEMCLISQPRKRELVTDRPVTFHAEIVLLLCSLILFYFRTYLVAHRQPRNGTDTISTGRTPAKEHRHNLHSYTHAAAVPYILSIQALATSK